MTQSPGAEEEPLVELELAGSWGVVTYPGHILSPSLREAPFDGCRAVGGGGGSRVSGAQ